MRLFSYHQNGTVHLAGYRGDQVVGLGAKSLLSVLQSEDGLAGLRSEIGSAPVIAASQIEIALPIPNPPKIICVGLNYLDHAAESPYKDPPTYPSVFGRFDTTLVAHEQFVRRPRCSEELDWEGELVAIVGRRGRHIRQEDALDYVAGYSIFNEVSLRDYQFKSSQWTIGKNFDATGAFGPEIVTPDELPRSVKDGLRIETRLNGTVVQSASTRDLIFDLPTLIATISEAITLEPGDLLVTGTPAGVGFARTPKLFMKDGDVVEVEIEGVGLLRNPIKDEVISNL